MEIGVITGLNPDVNYLAPVREMGFNCVQLCSWNPDHCTAEQLKRAKQMLSDYGIRISSFWAGYTGPIAWNFTEGPITLGLVPEKYRRERLDQLKMWADFAAELKAPAIVTHCGFLPENMTDPEFPRVVEALVEIGSYCKNLGMGFWFETGQETPVTLLRHITATGLDNLGINLDPANLLLYGKGNPVDSLDVFGRYVKSVHAKDGFCPTDGNSLGQEARLGDGIVHFDQLVPKLIKLGYTGDFIIEREISGEQQKLDIRHAETLLKGWMSLAN